MLESYKKWIDTWVDLSRESVSASRIREHGHPIRMNGNAAALSSSEQHIQAVCLTMNAEQRNVLELLLEQERSSAIHDVLAELEHQAGEDKPALYFSGCRLGGSPYASFHFDFVSRQEGDEWPDED
ncbi:DUF6547 family protein [Acuticoccus sediminis]|uniref:DUF6547 family protein n=1 Tax=Acuticoccus sediminis TaxID=2184697 RepID=UPI001CFE3880|nr:DUF6547 family protein [Acuticoccus sediminis]